LLRPAREPADARRVKAFRLVRVAAACSLGTVVLAAAGSAPALGAHATPHRGAVCASYHAGYGTHPESCRPPAGPPSGSRHRTCTNTGLRPTPTNLPLIRAATLCLINRERTAHGERALRPNRRLRRAAQTHSQSMAFGNYFEHDGASGPGGGTPLARIRNAGYISSSRVGYEVGENIAWGTLYLATPRAIVRGWMSSPAHRANILDAHFRETGIGVSARPPASLAHGQPGAIYTQDFGVIITG
jgi:uncharacterized protein YkwD